MMIKILGELDAHYNGSPYSREQIWQHLGELYDLEALVSHDVLCALGTCMLMLKSLRPTAPSVGCPRPGFGFQHWDAHCTVLSGDARTQDDSQADIFPEESVDFELPKDFKKKSAAAEKEKEKEKEKASKKGMYARRHAKKRFTPHTARFPSLLMRFKPLLAG